MLGHFGSLALLFDDDVAVSCFDDPLLPGLGELMAGAADEPAGVFSDGVVVGEREANDDDAFQVTAFADERDQAKFGWSRSTAASISSLTFLTRASFSATRCAVNGPSPCDLSGTRIRLGRDLLGDAVVLVDHDEALMLLDNLLDLGEHMAVDDDEPVALRPHGLVEISVDLNHIGARVLAAFADDAEPLSLCPEIVDRADAFVDLAEHRLVLGQPCRASRANGTSDFSIHSGIIPRLQSDKRPPGERLRHRRLLRIAPPVVRISPPGAFGVCPGIAV